MMRDDILEEYERLWRGAALEDRRQFHHGHPDGHTGRRGEGTCAALILEPFSRIDALVHSWRQRCECPECHVVWTAPTVLMIHLNNQHAWTWDRFANKFRDTLTAGEVTP